MRPISIKKEVFFTRGPHTRKVMQDSPPPEPSPVPEGRIPCRGRRESSLFGR